MRSMTSKEERTRDNSARDHYDDTKAQNCFKKGWDQCFEQNLVLHSQLKNEIRILKREFRIRVRTVESIIDSETNTTINLRD